MTTLTAADPWLTAEEIVPQLPGPPLAASTLRRWVLHGVRGKRAKALRRGGRLFFQLSTMLRFLQDVAGGSDSAEVD